MRTAPALPTLRAALRAPVLLLALPALVPGCGGGGGAAAVPAPGPAPSGLSYARNPAVYTKGQAIPPNAPTVGGGAVAAYTVTPALPAGLALDPATGVLSGTPAALAPTATYTVRASNAGGSATAALSLTVQDVAPAFEYPRTTFVLGKDDPLAPVLPTSTGGAVVSWQVAPELPAGLTLDGATGAFAGTPTAAAAPGTYTITATNSGGSLGKTLAITVVGAAPVIDTFAGPATVPLGDPALLTWALSGDPAATLTLNGAQLPLGQAGSAAVTPAGRAQYTLVATNLKGATQRSWTVAARGLTLLAGRPEGPGWKDGTGAAARFNTPTGVAVDGSGTFYVSDTFNHTLRKVTATGTLTTLAGTPGQAGTSDGTGPSAGFRLPAGLACDAGGNVYVADQQNHAIRKVTPAGVTTTFAGQPGSAGSADGTGTAARFNAPAALAFTPGGDLLVSDYGNHTLRRVTPAGVVTTLAGSAGASGAADGAGAATRFFYPRGLVVLGDGTAVVADTWNHTLRKVSPAGLVSTFAGTAGASGIADGSGAAARFSFPTGLALDGAGELWVTDLSHRLRKVSPAGAVTSVTDQAEAGWADGPAAASRFSDPRHLAFDGRGRLLLADSGNNLLRLLQDGAVTTLAGQPEQAGDADGFAEAARFRGPQGLVADGQGGAYVADAQNHTIRHVTAEGAVSTFAGRAGLSGSGDGAAAAARFNTPTGLARDGAGNLYVVDSGNHTLRRITPAGVVTTVAGSPGNPGTADGLGPAARFSWPNRIAVDAAGTLYVTDNQALRKVTPAGAVTTLAGLPGTSGLADGTGGAARFNLPCGLAVDASGTLYVGDMNNNRIRKVTPAGEVTTLPTSTFVYGPAELALEGDGSLLIADAWGHVVHRRAPDGTTTPLIGTPFLAGAFTGPLPAGLHSPVGLAPTPEGDLLIATGQGLLRATAP